MTDTHAGVEDTRLGTTQPRLLSNTCNLLLINLLFLFTSGVELSNTAGVQILKQHTSAHSRHWTHRRRSRCSEVTNIFPLRWETVSSNSGSSTDTTVQPGERLATCPVWLEPNLCTTLASVSYGSLQPSPKWYYESPWQQCANVQWLYPQHDAISEHINILCSVLSPWCWGQGQ